MKGLFQSSLLTKAEEFSRVSKCGTCGLYKNCRSPKLSPQGNGTSGVMVVLPPISKKGDEYGKFIYSGVGGEVKRLLLEHGIPLNDCWLTSAVICHSPNPTAEQIDACSFKLRESILKLKPKVVIAIGWQAVRNIIQFTWNREAENTERWYGYQIPSQLLNAWVCPVMAPSPNDEDCSRLLFARQFVAALKKDRPYPDGDIPDYKSEVNLVSEKEAVKFLRHIVREGGPAAFDFETNCLKPEHDKAAIEAVSICWRGTHTIAIPWYGGVIEAFRAFLLARNVGKIASNLQFEHRWCKAMLNIRVRNWIWDTMQAAHAADNRRKASGLKFQAFVRLGVPSYDEAIAPFLGSAEGDSKEQDSHALNDIKQIGLKDLLIYCGLDSLLEYKVAAIQAEEMGHPMRKVIR